MSCMGKLKTVKDERIGMCYTTAAQAVLNLIPYEILEEELSKFMLSQQPMSNWDAFQEGLVEMGCEELLEIYETAYSRIAK